MNEVERHAIATAKARLDLTLVSTGLFASRAKAQEAVEAGLVVVDGEVVRRSAAPVAPGAQIGAVAPYPWVSRGGVKLDAALDHFGIDPAGRSCLDVGASTGGFTHVLLDRGAVRVDAVDVGTRQLDPRIASDARVVDRSGVDIRSLEPTEFDPAPDLVVIDVSFISLRLVLPSALRLASKQAEVVALIKPQFEVGRGNTQHGIVRDEGLRRACCDAIAACVVDLGWQVQGILPSPITGGDGNQEFLIAARRR